MPKKDLIGKKFGHLTVDKMLYHYSDGIHNLSGKHTYCECTCDCGNKKLIEATKLQSRANPSCGCMTSYYKSINNRTNEIGQKFGRLTIIDIDYSTRPSTAICKCDCGNEVRVSKLDVVSKHTQSCGCLHKEMTSKKNTKDFTDYVFPNGVVAKTQSRQNKNGVWLWNCICPICGSEFEALPADVNINNVSSCGCKIKSSFERIIENKLDELGVDYVTQKRFPDCKYIYTLPFDFVIYNSDGSIKYIIEYDGKQHFEPISFFGGKDGYEKTKIRDNIKNEYCNKNNYKLVRFNYTQSVNEINEILTNMMNP